MHSVLQRQNNSIFIKNRFNFKHLHDLI
jgi:hypothetical protein